MLTYDMVRYNARLAHVLLADKGAIACAEAALPIYPFPDASDKMWLEPEGRMLLACAEMTAGNMHASPTAAAVYVFPPSWRAGASALATRRLVHGDSVTMVVEKLLLLFMEENNCSKAHARLQLAAAHVHPVNDAFWPGTHTIAAYVTYNSKGCHLHVRGAEPTCPELAQFDNMQDDLSCEEQLNYAIMTNDMSSVYQRVAYNHPLPLRCNGKTEECMRYCHECGVNWDTNWDSTCSDVLYCPAANCDFMVHSACAGTRTTCPFHTSCTLKRATMQSEGATDIVACTGLISVQGAWCFVLAQWPATDRCVKAVGLLHPVALHSVVRAADHFISTGQWHAQDSCPNTTLGGQKKLCEALTELSSLSHLRTTACEPDCWLPVANQQPVLLPYAEACSGLAVRPPLVCYPEEQGMGQFPSHAPPALRLGETLEQNLAALQIFHEPEFSRMCKRFKASGADVNRVLQQWMTLRLPLLPGESEPGTESAANRMHADALQGILSSITRARARTGGYAARHWSATQLDAVLPVSDEADCACMQRLQIQHVPPPPQEMPPPATACIASTLLTSNGDYGLFAVRVLMNPSARVSLTRKILKDAAARYQLGGTYETLLEREIAPILTKPTARDICAFRDACISSVMYGQVYMWLLVHGGQYTTIRETDATGQLASASFQTSEEWCGDWTPVEHLRACTDSAYASFGCGAMAHWQSVLMHGRRSFLFEQHLASLHAIASGPICGHTIHIVPCAWADLNLDCIGEASIVATVHRLHAVAPIASAKLAVHFLSPSSEGRQWAGSEWKHTQSHAEPFERTQYAYDTYMAMQS